MGANLTQKAYRHIHGKLTSGQLSPGSRLSNRGIAKEVGISFTPVREALQKLVSEGYLDYQPGEGVFVPLQSRREIEEIYELREFLEITAIEKCCGKMPEESLDEMARCIDTQISIFELFESKGVEALGEEDFRRKSNADARFHVTPLESMHNRRLSRFLDDIWARMHTVYFRLIDSPLESFRKLNIEEHQQILDGLRKGDLEAAQAALSEHIHGGLENILAAYDKIGMKTRETKPFWVKDLD